MVSIARVCCCTKSESIWVSSLSGIFNELVNPHEQTGADWAVTEIPKTGDPVTTVVAHIEGWNAENQPWLYAACKMPIHCASDGMPCVVWIDKNPISNYWSDDEWCGGPDTLYFAKYSRSAGWIIETVAESELVSSFRWKTFDVQNIDFRLGFDDSIHIVISDDDNIFRYYFRNMTSSTWYEERKEHWDLPYLAPTPQLALLPTNGLLNWDFEAEALGSWTSDNVSPWELEAELDDAVFKHGAQSIVFTSDAGKIGRCQQSINVSQSPQIHYLKGWIKTDSIPANWFGSVTIAFYNDEDELISERVVARITGTTAWKEYKSMFSIPENSDHALINCVFSKESGASDIEGDAKVWFDALAFGKESEPVMVYTAGSDYVSRLMYNKRVEIACHGVVTTPFTQWIDIDSGTIGDYDSAYPMMIGKFSADSGSIDGDKLYYVVEIDHSNNRFKVSETYQGTPITITDDDQIVFTFWRSNLIAQSTTQGGYDYQYPQVEVDNDNQIRALVYSGPDYFQNHSKLKIYTKEIDNGSWDVATVITGEWYGGVGVPRHDLAINSIGASHIVNTMNYDEGDPNEDAPEGWEDSIYEGAVVDGTWQRHYVFGINPYANPSERSYTAWSKLAIGISSNDIPIVAWAQDINDYPNSETMLVVAVKSGSTWTKREINFGDSLGVNPSIAVGRG